MMWKRIRGWATLVYYFLFAQAISFAAPFWYFKLRRQERTPATHYYHRTFLKYLFGATIHYRDPVMREKVRRLPTCLLLCNHRTHVDFSVCILSTAPEKVGIVSRGVLFFLFPLAFLYAWAFEKNLILFNRAQKDRVKMKAQLFKRTKAVLDRGIFVVVFPEGHRYTGHGTLPLKKGTIEWAYQNNFPCAVVLHANNEKVYDERKMIIRHGVTIDCLHQGIYRPSDYVSFDLFYEAVSQAFQQGYVRLLDQ